MGIFRSKKEDLGENLKPSDNHYRAFVGPPRDYDLVASMCFNLLTSAGLRGHQKVLDIGCGSLRVGRLLIPYLNKGNYTGVEPNKWLVYDGINNEVGKHQIKIKNPTFIFSDTISQLQSNDYDYALAQSIFSHTGHDLTNKWLSEISSHLNDSAVLLCTFIVSETDTSQNGWVYPGCVTYTPQTIKNFANKHGFECMKLNWSHPRQSWFAFSKPGYDSTFIKDGHLAWNRNVQSPA